MNCSELHRELPLYLSGEMVSEAHGDAEDHLRTCDACAGIVASERQLDELVRGAFAQEDSDMELQRLRERVRQEIRSTTEAVPRFGWSPQRWAAAAALIVFCGLGAFFVVHRDADTRLYRAAVSDHVDDAVTRVSKEGWLTKPAEIKSFVIAQFGTDEFLPQLAPPAFQLKRVRMCNLKGNGFAHFIYEVDGREVSFFVQNRSGELPGARLERGPGPPVYAHASDGYQVAGSQTAKFTVLIVTDFARAENVRLAEQAAAHLS